MVEALTTIVWKCVLSDVKTIKNECAICQKILWDVVRSLESHILKQSIL